MTYPLPVSKELMEEWWYGWGRFRVLNGRILYSYERKVLLDYKISLLGNWSYMWNKLFFLHSYKITCSLDQCIALLVGQKLVYFLWLSLPAREGWWKDTDMWVRRQELELWFCPPSWTVSVQVQINKAYASIYEETGYKNVARVEKGNPGNHRKWLPPVGWKDRERRWCYWAKYQGSPVGMWRERVSGESRP